MRCEQSITGPASTPSPFQSIISESEIARIDCRATNIFQRDATLKNSYSRVCIIYMDTFKLHYLILFHAIKTNYV